MFGDADGVAVLVYDLDFCDGLARFFVHRDDLIIAGDRVAKIDGTCEAHMIIAVRSNGAFIVVRLMDECGCGARKRKSQHTMSNTGAILRALHVFFVHMKWTEITRDPSKLVNIRLGDGLGERLLIAN